MTLAVRPARPGDAGFMTRMLAAAATWRPGSPALTSAQVLADPALAHYIAGWPRFGDVGVIAEEAGERVGAAWLRTLSSADPGYGYVDDATPELSIGVVAERRGTGVGTALLTALLREASLQGTTAVSLSVEPDNPAARLYGRFGFAPVGQNAGSLTMLLRWKGIETSPPPR